MIKILLFSSISALLGATLFSCVAAASEYLWPDGSGDLFDSQGNYYFSNGDDDYIGPDGTYYWSDDNGETLYGPDGAMFWSDGDGGYIQY